MWSSTLAIYGCGSSSRNLFFMSVRSCRYVVDPTGEREELSIMMSPATRHVFKQRKLPHFPSIQTARAIVALAGFPSTGVLSAAASVMFSRNSSVAADYCDVRTAAQWCTLSFGYCAKISISKGFLSTMYKDIKWQCFIAKSSPNVANGYTDIFSVTKVEQHCSRPALPSFLFLPSLIARTAFAARSLA